MEKSKLLSQAEIKIYTFTEVMTLCGERAYIHLAYNWRFNMMQKQL
jgi:hypothetical protein